MQTDREMKIDAIVRELIKGRTQTSWCLDDIVDFLGLENPLEYATTEKWEEAGFATESKIRFYRIDSTPEDYSEDGYYYNVFAIFLDDTLNGIFIDPYKDCDSLIWRSDIARIETTRAILDLVNEIHSKYGEKKESDKGAWGVSGVSDEWVERLVTSCGNSKQLAVFTFMDGNGLLSLEQPNDISTLFSKK